MERMNYRIFIVSIERNKKRYMSLLEKLEEQGFDKNLIEVFIGIDYKKDRIPSHLISKWGKYTPKSVLACSASHILLWNYISKQNIDFALILEDDSYVIKEKFDNYLNEFKKVINDETFVNLSTSYTIPERKESKVESELFTKSLVILALDTYILTPKLCKKLFEFYKNNGLSYHIDLHLTFVKPFIPMRLLHFNKKITEGNLRYESTMVSNHDKKFLLRLLKNTETYKELNTPIIEYQNIVINTYHIIVFLLFLVILTITFLLIQDINNVNILVLMFISMLWLFLGFCIYDILI